MLVLFFYIEEHVMITYRVSLSGNLVADLLPAHAMGGTNHLVIPSDVALRGVDVVRAYVATELTLLQQTADEARRKRRLLLESSDRDLSIAVGEITIVGALCYTGRPRALYTVRLLSPEIYRAEITVFGNAARAQLRGIETHSPLGTWLPEVVAEAEEVLVRLYQDKLHQHRHAAAYALASALNL
jgi:hypothetical protein